MKKTLYILVLGILLGSLLVGAFGCQSSPTFKWRMATSWTADNLFYTKAGQAICDKAIEMDPSLKIMRQEKKMPGL